MRPSLFHRILLVILLCLVQNVTMSQQNDVHRLTWICTDGLSAPMLRASLSDGKPRLFIVNTSEALTLIDRDVAKEAGLTASLPNPRPTGFVKSPLHVGPDIFTLADVPFGLTDLSLLRRDEPDIAGVLGMNVLSHLTLRMDYSKQQMDVIVGASVPPSDLPKDVTRIPLKKSGDLYYVEASVDDHEDRFVINTGIDRPFLRVPDLLRSLKPKGILAGFHTFAPASGDSLGSFDTRLLRLNSLTLSGLKWANPIFEQQDIPNKNTIDALGNDFLKQFHVVLDFPASMLYLTPDPAFKAKDDEWIGTGITLGIGESKIIIAGIFSPSPAQAAGLEEGEEIVSVDGHPLKGLMPEEVINLFRAKKKIGETITLEVMHPNQSTTQSVKLQVKSLL